jgi:hypothetical protein
VVRHYVEGVLVVEQKPTVASMKQVGWAHKTQAKAEKAMKVAKDCATK